jgi:bifunctional non-homologous end joining protein LigD
VGLREYFNKRRFHETPEPKGKEGRASGRRLAFVVQEHHASRLHYDFRLEIDGVLKSWAVPKGPSLDPHEHHLAVQTEDHPFEYRKFEGVIPEGNYGAGNVIIWDEGWYEARKDNAAESEKTLRAELKKGHLTFILHGKKLKGEFALIKMQNAKDDDAWLLVKKGDEYATAADVTKQDESVKSHKRVDDLGGKAPDLSDFPKKTKPWQVNPMLCTLVDEPFSQGGWLFEIKWDGYRAVSAKHGSDVGLYSRNHLNFLEKYAPVAEAVRGLEHDVILDGEIVVVDDGGSAHFEWLQHWGAESEGHLQYFIFDILWCDGHDVRSMPLIQRKALLKHVLPADHPVLRYSDHIEDAGLKLFKEMQHRGLEGIVAKRADSEYREGNRGADWLKIKTHRRQEVVIGGYTEPRGSRQYLGSLLVGVYDKSKFIYVGHSGGGIPDSLRKELRDKLARRERKTSPFTVEPKPNAPVHWVKPEIVAEMSFAEWTSDGYMRHPQFEGLRNDKDPLRVRKEIPERPEVAAPLPAATSGLPFDKTHEDKVFFPKHKYTKGNLFKYYESMAEYILPYLAGRPHSMNRMPGGINGPSFYQKNNEHLPDWVPHADIFSESNNEDLRWIVGGDLPTLLYMVQLGCVEINPWNSRVKHLEKPDWIVIDLDPEGIGFEKVIEVARTVHEVCDEWGIPAYPKTSGKTGLHIYIPMAAKYTYEQCKNVAHLIALEVNKRQPKITSVERMPEKRKHKIYLDYLQNREGQTLAAPYSVRPTPDASVSMPLHWDEVKPGLEPSDFTIENALKRVKRTGDLWKPVLGPGIELEKLLKKLENIR